jgi:hypothetical protein
VGGRRGGVSAEGGRLRRREHKRGAKTPKGRTRYRGAGREPKRVILYGVDARGKLETRLAPLIEGPLQGPKAVFPLREGYWHALAIDRADPVLFGADGAHGLWNRIPKLIGALGLEPPRVHLLIDFYPAPEHVGKLAPLRKNWSARQRHAGIRTQRPRLGTGHLAQVVEASQVFCRGRNRKAMRTERDYFVGNRQRMAYHTVRALKLPLGRGALESAIRRGVNLPLKGASIVWGKDNAEKILLLRAFYKAGRWSLLKQRANSPPSLVTA